ncbi:MAG: ABC transporter permease [Afipia sp.]|nr:ABC transporter permease [Afipia sp.]
MEKKLFRFSSSFALLVAVIVVWELVAGTIYPKYNPVSVNIFPPPTAVVKIFWEMLRSGELITHALASISRVAVGFTIATVIAIPLGLSMGAWPLWGEQMRVVVEVLRPIPPFAWIPFGLLWFGVGPEQTVFVIVISSVFPILMNTVAGVEQVEPVLKRSALSLGANKFRLFVNVVLPRALPQIIVGLRIGLGFAWMVLVASELIGSTAGLGYLILDSRNLGLPSLAFMGMFVIGVIGYLLDAGMRWLERILLPWNA